MRGPDHRYHVLHLRSILTPSQYSHCPESPLTLAWNFGGKTSHISLVCSPLKPNRFMSGSLDHQCPSCHRRFPNDSLVLRHMNNPNTSCASWFDFLESISTSLGQSHHPADRHTPDSGTGDDGSTHDNESTSNRYPSTATHYEDTHPNTPFIFGSGPGFMDTFNADQNAEKRRGNLYYPFSSKEEWGLASWLLCSGLSMRAIDDFLTLPIVSLENPEEYVLLIENQGPAAFALLYDCKNATQPHGRSSQDPPLENARHFN